MRRLITCILFTLNFFTILAQTRCETNSPDVMKTYYKANKVRSNDTFYYSHNIFSISLAGDFNDSLKMYIGDSLILNELVSNASRKLIQTNFKVLSDSQFLKIFLVNQKKCLTELLNFKFPILEIRLKEKWYLTYTNTFSSLE